MNGWVKERRKYTMSLVLEIEIWDDVTAPT
jgi:hypothetical protein